MKVGISLTKEREIEYQKDEKFFNDNFTTILIEKFQEKYKDKSLSPESINAVSNLMRDNFAQTINNKGTTEDQKKELLNIMASETVKLVQIGNNSYTIKTNKVKENLLENDSLNSVIRPKLFEYYKNQTIDPERKRANTLEAVLQEPEAMLNKVKNNMLDPVKKQNGFLDDKLIIQSYKHMDEMLADAKKNAQKKGLTEEDLKILDKKILDAKEKLLGYILEISPVSKAMVSAIKNNNQDEITSLTNLQDLQDKKNKLVDKITRDVIKNSKLENKNDKISKILKPSLEKINYDLLQDNKYTELLTEGISQFLEGSSHTNVKLQKTITTERLEKLAEMLEVKISESNKDYLEEKSKKKQQDLLSDLTQSNKSTPGLFGEENKSSNIKKSEPVAIRNELTKREDNNKSGYVTNFMKKAKEFLKAR